MNPHLWGIRGLTERNLQMLDVVFYLVLTAFPGGESQMVGPYATREECTAAKRRAPKSLSPRCERQDWSNLSAPTPAQRKR